MTASAHHPAHVSRSRCPGRWSRKGGASRSVSRHSGEQGGQPGGGSRAGTRAGTAAGEEIVAGATIRQRLSCVRQSATPAGQCRFQVTVAERRDIMRGRQTEAGAAQTPAGPRCRRSGGAWGGVTVSGARPLTGLVALGGGKGTENWQVDRRKWRLG